MRILHTSDWHLGRTLHGVNLLDHQAEYLDHLSDLVRSERVDAVLVSGDIFDRAIPSVDAVSLLSDALDYLSTMTTVVVTSGNHDSPVRLGFASGAMRDNLHVRVRVADIAKPVALTGRDGTRLLVYTLPYLDPHASRGELRTLAGMEVGERIARSHEAVIGRALGVVRTDAAQRGADGLRGPRVVVMGHMFVGGGLTSASEQDIRVGGVDRVPVSVFDCLPNLDYVALGHLHGAQRIPVEHRSQYEVRYAGSPLPYSFSEAAHIKSTTVVDVGDFGLYEIEQFPAPVVRRMAELVGTLDEILSYRNVRAHEQDWLSVKITDPNRPSDLMARIKEKYPHALRVEHVPPRREREEITINPTTINPVKVASEFVEYVTGAAPELSEMATLQRATEIVHEKERVA